MWVEKGEEFIVEYMREVFLGLYVIGMVVNVLVGVLRMGLIFGGMFLSGRKVVFEIF